jgi:hypothetical protein
MKKTLILWLGALLITFLAGYIESGTSEYYPVTGTIGINGKKVSYKFDKIFSGKDNYRLIIRTDNPDVTGIVKWKKENESEWNKAELIKEEKALLAEIPKQESGEKIIYFAELFSNDKTYIIPNNPVKLLFLGYVPFAINFLSFFTLFGGLLLCFRTGLEFFNENQKIKKLSLFTVSFFFLYTVTVTPLRKSYELDAINKKVVPITSLWDVQSILLFVLWIAAMIVLFKVKNPKLSALVFSAATLLVFLFVRV